MSHVKWTTFDGCFNAFKEELVFGNINNRPRALWFLGSPASIDPISRWFSTNFNETERENKKTKKAKVEPLNIQSWIHFHWYGR